MQLGRRSCLAIASAAALSRKTARAAEPLRLGLLRTLSPAPLLLAQERDYFRQAGCAVSFVFFDAAQPIAAAAVAGDLDVGLTALTGGFFALAGKGELKVIGGGLHEQKGFDGTQVLVSNAAYAAGLVSLDKLPGHSFAITQYGSSFHYMLGRIAEAEKFDLKSVSLRPVQQVTNMLAAVRSGQVDATMAIASQAKILATNGEAHVIANCGDVVPYQLTALFAPNRAIDTRAGDLHAFCAAYQRGIVDYRAAFLAPNPPKALVDAAVADIGKYVFIGDPKARAKILDGVVYYDPGGALDARDVAAQSAWFEAQGMVKTHADPKDIIDSSFLPTL